MSIFVRFVEIIGEFRTDFVYFLSIFVYFVYSVENQALSYPPYQLFG